MILCESWKPHISHQIGSVNWMIPKTSELRGDRSWWSGISRVFTWPLATSMVRITTCRIRDIQGFYLLMESLASLHIIWSDSNFWCCLKKTSRAVVFHCKMIACSINLTHKGVSPFIPWDDRRWQMHLDATLPRAPAQRQQETEATLEASDEETKSEETAKGGSRWRQWWDSAIMGG